jgi:hypothetical protein
MFQVPQANPLCKPMPPPEGRFYTGKLYLTGKTTEVSQEIFNELKKQSPELVKGDWEALFGVVVVLDDSCVGAIQQSLCFTQGFPKSLFNNIRQGDNLEFKALGCFPMKLSYMGLYNGV